MSLASSTTSAAVTNMMMEDKKILINDDYLRYDLCFLQNQFSPRSIRKPSTKAQCVGYVISTSHLQ